jgi:formamidopyrimidine-DNA glycosylase
VLAVERRGKWLRLSLDAGPHLFVHLGMTGWFEHPRGADPSNPHGSKGGATGDHLRFERVRFVVERHGRTSGVVYVDPRRWGRMILASDEEGPFAELGPDPLSDGIDLAELAQALTRRKRQSIKEALMDQRVLAGVGNIQAIEALWKARIDPRRPARTLDRLELARVASGLRWTIARTLEGLEAGEETASPFRVYGRAGLPCPRCKTRLERIVLGGRTTTFCPRCQPASS